MAKVLLKFKEAVMKDIPLDQDVVTIGRNETNDIHIENLAVSSFHAKINRKGDQYIIEDLNSTNGTYVNDKKIGKAPLNDGDVVTIGKHQLVFSGGAEGAAAAPQKEDKPDLEATMMLDTKKQKAAGGATAAAAGERIGGLTVIEGATDQNEYRLTGRVATIGKSETALVKLKGFFAPATACLINRTKDGYVMAPSEGKKTKVNGQTLEGRHTLKDGDIIEVPGGVKLQFYLE